MKIRRETATDLVVVLAVVILFLGAMKAFGQDKTSDPVGLVVSNKNIVIAYQAAIIKQQTAQGAAQAAKQAQDDLTKAVADYHAVEATEAKVQGLPVGTTFTVDLGTGKATAVPPVKAEVKPEKK